MRRFISPHARYQIAFPAEPIALDQSYVNVNNNALNDPGSRQKDFELQTADDGHAVTSLTDYFDKIARAAYRRRIEGAVLESYANPPEARFACGANP